ncbi:hypothetical protein FACS1894133_5860 [Clostridia bacterium]|nr:hypothetical protein FACS1894133_5860 [Clostridia bacterium]
MAYNVGAQSDKLKSRVEQDKRVSTGFGGAVASGIQHGISAQNNLSAQTVSGVISAAKAGTTAFKAAQAVSPAAVKMVKFVAPNVVNAVKTVSPHVFKAGAVTVRVVRNSICSAAVTAHMTVKTGGIKIDRDMLRQMAERNAINIRRGAYFAKLAVKRGVKYTVQTVKTTVKVVRHGVATAAVTASFVRNVGFARVSKDVSKHIGKQVAKNAAKFARFGRQYAIKTLKPAAANVKKFAVKHGKLMGKAAVRGAKAGINAGVTSLGTAMLRSDDTGVQAIGASIKTVHIGGKVARNTGKFAIRTVKGGIKTAKRTYLTARWLKTKGLKKTVRRQFLKFRRKIVSLFNNLARSLMSKVLIPLIIIIAVVAVGMSAASAPISGIASIFGGIFSIFEKKPDGTEEYKDFDTNAYLLEKITKKRGLFAASVLLQTRNNLVSNGGAYHYVRLFSEDDSATVLTEVKTGTSTDEVTAKVLSTIDSADKLAQLLSPMFTTMILQEYNLMPTAEQADDLIDDLWNSIMKTQLADLPTEYCGEASPECGEVHAKSDCPNYKTEFHTSYTCGSCDTETHNDDGSISFNCSGCHHCLGHRILSITLDEDGYYELLNKYFYQPIEELANKESRTDEENEKLDTLRNNASLCVDLINEMAGITSDGAGNTDLSGVEFVDGARAGNKEIVDFAIEQKGAVGSIGGEKFWRDLGYSSRIEWCATFVSFCGKHTNNVPKAFPIFTACTAGIQYFKDHGQWNAGIYDDPAPGDLIFFDWEKDGVANHVGIVIGHDNERVYTIEGNSNDNVAIRSYPLTSGVIFGYGLPNY